MEGAYPTWREGSDAGPRGRPAAERSPRTPAPGPPSTITTYSDGVGDLIPVPTDRSPYKGQSPTTTPMPGCSDFGLASWVVPGDRTARGPRAVRPERVGRWPVDSEESRWAPTRAGGPRRERSTATAGHAHPATPPAGPPGSPQARTYASSVLPANRAGESARPSAAARPGSLIAVSRSRTGLERSGERATGLGGLPALAVPPAAATTRYRWRGHPRSGSVVSAARPVAPPRA
jgi:hypothetical protein